MSVTVNVAGTSVPVDPSALKDLRADLKLAFQLDGTLHALLSDTLDKVPASARKSSIAYTSPVASWSPPGSAVTFGLQGGASGELEIVCSGDLLSYTDGLDAPQAHAVPAVPGMAHLKLTLGFNISGNATGTYSGGAYGVRAEAAAAAVYRITFAKAFVPSSTTVRDALARTFQSFVLPLHPRTLGSLSPGDFLLFAFDGNIHLSFGAYAGLSDVLYAGQSSVDVVQSSLSPLTLSAAVQPTITLGARLDFALAYATRFEALLSKPSAGVGRMHLFRASSTSASTTLKAGLTFDDNTSASITSHLQTVTDSMARAAGTANPAAGAALTKVLSQAGAQTDKYVTEVNDKLTSWLNRANGVQFNLQAAIESSNTRTLLAGYSFDLTSPAFPQAWDFAVGGDLVQAFHAGSVSLDPGSGLEHAYQRKTSFRCHFFNLWSMSTWNEFQSKTTLVYAGNNIFHLQASVGRTLQTQSLGAMHSINLYFAASASLSQTRTLSATDVDLHIDLTARADPRAAAAVATLLLQFSGGPQCDALGHAMRVFASNAAQGTAQLQVTLPASAYANVHCDPYNGSHPQTADTSADQTNWNAFASAADDLNAWSLAQFSALSDEDLASLRTFAAWADLNQAANGDSRPNRVNVGAPYTTWPSGFPNALNAGQQTQVVYSMLAGQSFMNFCAALVGLAKATSSSTAGATWNGLLQLITDAVRQDVSGDFIRPTALAVMRLSRSSTTSIEGPNPAAPTTTHFAVSLTL